MSEITYGNLYNYGDGEYKGEPSTKLEYIDYLTRARALVIEQFEGSERLLATIDAIMAQIQDLDDTLFVFSDDLSLRTAIGAQLDRVGEVLGVFRAGKSDSEYRVALNLQVFLNNSIGAVNDVVSYAGFVIQSGVKLSDNGNATISLLLDTPDFVKALEALIGADRITAGGVRVNGFVQADGLVLRTTEPTLSNKPDTGSLLEYTYLPSTATAGKLIEHIRRS